MSGSMFLDSKVDFPQTNDFRVEFFWHQISIRVFVILDYYD